MDDPGNTVPERLPAGEMPRLFLWFVVTLPERMGVFFRLCLHRDRVIPERTGTNPG